MKKGTPKAGGILGLIGSIEKKHGKGSIMDMDAHAARSGEVIPTGSIALDEALGIGGYPVGRITEVYGPESSGKTTLTLHAIAEAQRLGKLTAFIDAEHALDLAYAEGLGVDASKLLVSQPDCGEQALDIAELLVRSGEVGLVVVDSVAALTPRAEIEGEVGDHHVGVQARMMSQALRKLNGIVSTTGATLIFINQLRQKIGVTFGNPETTTGGNALKFYCSARLDVRRIATLKDSDGEAVANRVRVKVVKNKVGRPYRRAEFELRYGRGICVAGEALDIGVDRGVIDKSGAWYAWDNERLGQGRERVVARLYDEPELLTRLRSALRRQSDVLVGEPDPPATQPELRTEAA